jgi:tetratricopeptide (TPR) repeat protein
VPRALLLALLLLPQLASAQTPDARARARRHYEIGERHQRAGDYDAAIAEYQAAYDLAPLPGLLFNLGQAFRLKGEKRQALAHYKLFLATAPQGRAAVEAEGHVRALEAAIAAEPPPAPTPPPLAPAEPPAPPPRGHGLRIAGYVTGGVGLAALGAGVTFGLRARSLARETEATFDPDKHAEGEAAERNMIIATAVGAAAVIAGVTLVLVDRGAARRVEVAPVAFGGGGGVLVLGRF